MLQQTQVATVIPFYQRFLEAFPRVSRLAQAPLERVLELWSGLGYYRRARHLHQAAQLIAQNHAERIPQDYDSVRRLPGIGDYTAKALLSIAFNQPFAVLDGNVARVIARLECLPGNLHQPRFRQAVEAALAQMLCRKEPGNFNQALMELGQAICLPRGPRCPVCPLARWCAAFRSGNPEAWPAPRPRRAAEPHHLAVALLRHGNKLAMVRGLTGGLLNDLWNFPSAFGKSPAKALQALHQKLAALFGQPDRSARERHPVAQNLRAASRGLLLPSEPMAEFRHNITFRAIQGRVYSRKLLHLPRKTPLRWFNLSQLPQAAISQLARKVLKKALIPPGRGQHMPTRRSALRSTKA